MATSVRAGTPDRLPPLDPTAGLSWIIERAGRAVGYLILSFVDPEDRVTRQAYIAGLFVEPEERGKGVGPLAQRFAADVGRTLGLRIHATGIGGENKEPTALALR